MSNRPHLRSLADRVGILPAYLDVTNTRRTTKDATWIALLAAMGLDGSSEAAAEQTLAELDRLEGQRLLEPVCVVKVRHERSRRVRLTIPTHDPAPIEWHIELNVEDGTSHVAEGRSKPRERDGTILVPLPTNPPAGYHRLRAALALPGGVAEAEQSLIVSPERCFLPSERVGARRVYGLWTNLYTVRSRRNWGVGDLTDLCELARSAGGHGAAFVGLNPLHALRNRGGHIGPYCPVSRLFRNVMYLDIKAVPEFAESREAQARFESPAFQAELERVRSASHVEYESAVALKNEILRLLHTVFVERHLDSVSDRGRAYTEYLAAQGKPLIDFATFLALEERLTERGCGGTDWRSWPQEYHAPDSPEVEAFRSAHRREVDFHCYVQFEIDRQLAAAAAEVRRAGVALGVYQDLALGSAADGSDAWTFPNLFLRGVKVGAPPDPYSEAGQTWGFPPIDPRGLATNRYDYWTRLLRAATRTGMVRMDHVMGLFRQFWVPDGLSPADGAYVRYPAKDLLGILALESQRHQAVIVGEDLGTVPRELPSILARWGILSSQVMYFERYRRGGFRPAASYSRRALVTATSHDHPPLAGFWTGRDLDIRHEIGLIASDRELQDARAERGRTRAALLRRLRAEGVCQEDDIDSLESLCAAVHVFLTRTPCPLVGVSLDDLAGETEPVNLPGVGLDRYRSWSRRMPRSIEDLLADPMVRELLDRIRDHLDR